MSGKRKIQYEDEDFKHIVVQTLLKCFSLIFKNGLIQELQKDFDDLEKQILRNLTRGMK